MTVDDSQSWLAFEASLFRYDPREWLVMTGDRLLVAALFLVGVGAVFALLVVTDLVPLRKETPVLFLLFALVGGNFTLIAIVTSLSQFVLARRLESPGEIRAEIDETIGYREAVGVTLGRTVMPVKADAYFLVLYRGVREELAALERASEEGRTRRARVELDELVSGLRSHTDYVIDLLERPSSGMKHALFTSLSADYENHAHRAWYLRSEHAGEFTDRAVEPLSRLTELLEHIEVASRTFKTVFIESEVAELSRFLLYVGLPVQVGAVAVMALYSAPGSEPPLPMPVLEVVFPAVLTAGFAPFLILSSYVVRFSVVARRTADSFPFSSQLDSTVAIDGDESDWRD